MSREPEGEIEDAVPSRSSGSPVRARAVALDFKERREEEIPLEKFADEIANGERYVWLDVEYDDNPAARKYLEGLGLIPEEVMDDVLSEVHGAQQARYPQFNHLVLTGCVMKKGEFELQRVDVLTAERYMLTIHRGKVPFLEQVKREYREDFLRFAKSPSFLLYEIWDHLIDGYVAVQKRLEERVEELQRRLIDQVDERVFGEVSSLGSDLLNFRKIVIPARAVLTDLSTRKSIFVSEATQPFLANMVGTLERVLQDLMADRDILSDSLNLYMSMVGHRTNRVMNRLTVVSLIFLPLSFLCGVYGMNFEVLPETKWQYGYLYFWLLALGIALLVGWLLRRMKVW